MPRPPKRGMTVQYQESDLAFLKRLLAEEGLFCWFAHQAEALGRHTQVIADHNGAFAANPQARFRFTQSGATLAEDSVDRWYGQRRLDSTDSHAGSWDYRSLSCRPQAAGSTIANGNIPRTVAWHDPGQYAWQSSTHGERMLGNQRQAIDARLKQFIGEGTVRTAAPGSTFHLADHPEHRLGQGDADHFLITAVRHTARANLAEQLPDAVAAQQPTTDQAAADAHDFYRNEFTAIRAAIPWRPLMADAHGRHVHPRPTGQGLLTGIVVGNGSPTHTDRDGRIRVQFPWQRGAQAASRQEHPAGSENAPASDALGVWLRVLSPVAGANWGGHLTPRPGQEVLVGFQNGNIDRPVVVGTAYNGQGEDDAQGNRIGSGTMQASANAPAFFAGKEAAAHTHGASLSGIKSQQLNSTRSGQGGFNQLVFDDTPGEGRIELASSQYCSYLQLGHLKQQSDNARLADRGHGGELATRAFGAIRAGSGLLLSADARANASSSQLDSREPVARTESALSLSQTLADLAAKQNAALKGDPAADQLPAHLALKHAGEVMNATSSRNANGASDGSIKATRGGTGSIPAWSEPRLQYSAPAGIAQLTPHNHFLVAGKSLSIASGQDSNLIAQGKHALAVKDGLALFTHGKSKNGQKPNQETGTHLHAASGTVSLQAQSGKITAAADKKVTIASTQASLTASAKKKILATAQGAYLKIEGGNIELHAPNKVEFKASKKVWTGPASGSPEAASLRKAALQNIYTPEENRKFSAKADLSDYIGIRETTEVLANLPYEFRTPNGEVLALGTTDSKGDTGAVYTKTAQKVVLDVGDGAWNLSMDAKHDS